MEYRSLLEYRASMNKKANLQDLFIIMALIFGTAISLFVIYYIGSKINPEITSALSGTEANATTSQIMSQNTSALLLFNNMFPIFLAGLILWVVISAFMVRSNPLMFFISIIILVIAIMVGVLLAKAHDKIRQETAWADEMEEWQLTSWIVNKLPYIILVVGVIVSVILYAKWAAPGGGV